MSTYRRIIPEQVVAGRRLGRHVNHDPRSLRFLVSSPARTLKSVEHQRVVPVFNQGNVGSCTGNAAVGAVGTTPVYESLPSGHLTLDEPLSVKVYGAATQLDDAPGTYPPTDTGSDGLSAAKACKALGLISGYLHATSLSAMRNALQDTPVIVGVNWYEGFDQPDASGLVKVSGEVRGGHEFEVVGLDESRQIFHAVNSWGTGWGVKGHFYFSYADMERLLGEEGDCTQLLPLTVPAPAPAPVPPSPQPVPDADATLVAAMDPWAATVLSRITKAGRAKTAYTTWKAAKGL